MNSLAHLTVVMALVSSSPAFAQSAEETAALLYDGVSDAKTNNPHEDRERISENPLTFRRWDDEGKTKYTDWSFEQIDGCRFRVVFSMSGVKSANIIDFSKHTTRQRLRRRPLRSRKTRLAFTGHIGIQALNALSKRMAQASATPTLGGLASPLNCRASSPP
jgi:hypothetical protein